MKSNTSGKAWKALTTNDVGTPSLRYSHVLHAGVADHDLVISTVHEDQEAHRASYKEVRKSLGTKP